MGKLTDFALAHHSIYRAFRRLTGSDRVNREFIGQYAHPAAGNLVLDVGCGPGDVFELLPDVNYVGIDQSENYIRFARNRFGGKARFLCSDLNGAELEKLGKFDEVLAMGVIHHLSDQEVGGMLQRIREILKPGGRFISYDPCFTEPQHPFARWIHSRDRGQFVRYDAQYERLISQVFKTYQRHVRTDLCTVPASVIIFECSL